MKKNELGILTEYFGVVANCLVCSPHIVCLNCRITKKKVSELLKANGLPYECSDGFLSQAAYNAALGLAEADYAAALDRARIMWPETQPIEVNADA